MEIFFETNEFASDERSGRKNDLNECNVLSLQGCDANLGCDENDSGYQKNISTQEWNAYQSKNNFEIDAEKAVWNDLNPCNKYMIYERKVEVNTIITKLSVEPLFFFGRWFFPIQVLDNRKARSTIIDERIHFIGNGYFEMYHIFLKPSAYTSLHDKSHSQAIQIFTAYQGGIAYKGGLLAKIWNSVAILDSYPSSSGYTYECDMNCNEVGFSTVTVPTDNKCMVELETFGSKILDATFHDAGFICNNVMVKGIYQYAMEKSLIHFLIPGLDYSPIMQLIY